MIDLKGDHIEKQVNSRSFWMYDHCEPCSLIRKRQNETDHVLLEHCSIFRLGKLAVVRLPDMSVSSLERSIDRFILLIS